MAGAMKFRSNPQMVDEYKRYGVPSWFRILIGLLEIGGAVLMIWGIWNESLAAAGGLLLAVIMIGAVTTHLRIKDPMTRFIAPFVLLILSIIVLILNGSALFG